MTRLSLETGNSPLFAAANHLYRRDGFTRCGPFGGYRATPFTLFYTREIYARSIRAAKQPRVALCASI